MTVHLDMFITRYVGRNSVHSITSFTEKFTKLSILAKINESSYRRELDAQPDYLLHCQISTHT